MSRRGLDLLETAKVLLLLEAETGELIGHSEI